MTPECHLPRTSTDETRISAWNTDPFFRLAWPSTTRPERSGVSAGPHLAERGDEGLTLVGPGDQIEQVRAQRFGFVVSEHLLGGRIPEPRTRPSGSIMTMAFGL